MIRNCNCGEVGKLWNFVVTHNLNAVTSFEITTLHVALSLGFFVGIVFGGTYLSDKLLSLLCRPLKSSVSKISAKFDWLLIKTMEFNQCSNWRQQTILLQLTHWKQLHWIYSHHLHRHRYSKTLVHYTFLRKMFSFKMQNTKRDGGNYFSRRTHFFITKSIQNQIHWLTMTQNNK